MLRALYRSPGTRDLLATTPHDSPLIVQLFGNDPAIMVTAMEELMQNGFRWFDPIWAVLCQRLPGNGAAMLRDVPNALLVASHDCHSRQRACFKLRLGWEAGKEVILTLKLLKTLSRVGDASSTLCKTRLFRVAECSFKELLAPLLFLSLPVATLCH